MKSYILAFSQTDAPAANLTLPLKKVKVNSNHNLNHLGSTCVPNAKYQVLRSICSGEGEVFFKVFTIYMYRQGDHDGHVTRTV